MDSDQLDPLGRSGYEAAAGQTFGQPFGQTAPPFDPTAISPKTGLDERTLLRARDAVFARDEGEGEETEDAIQKSLESMAKGVTKVG